MSKKPKEWLKQAEYDMKTAVVLFESRRYIYTVFMCHLSIEKAFKGLVIQNLAEDPPKTHSLTFLISKLAIELPDDKNIFIMELNQKSVPTRYPEDLQRMMKEFSKKKTEEVLKESRELLSWIKAQYQK